MAVLQRSAGNRAVTTFIERQGLISRRPGDPPSGESAAGEQGGAQKQETADSSAPESHWVGGIDGYLSQHPTAYHTLNNFSGTQLEYVLRVKNEGECAFELETQYEYKTVGLQRAWTALYAVHGETKEVQYGLPPHSSVHLRLFGSLDQTRPDGSYCKGTAEVTLKK